MGDQAGIGGLFGLVRRGGLVECERFVPATSKVDDHIVRDFKAAGDLEVDWIHADGAKAGVIDDDGAIGLRLSRGDPVVEGLGFGHTGLDQVGGQWCGVAFRTADAPTARGPEGKVRANNPEFRGGRPELSIGAAAEQFLIDG
jgi:hypothetical protein